MGGSIIILSLRIWQWFPQATPFALAAGLLSFLPWVFDFRNFNYGNSGLETGLYMVALASSIVVGPGAVRRYPLFSWLIIGIRPEGWLAGMARFCTAWLVGGDSENRKSSLFWAGCAVLIWLLAGIVLFDSLFPQSIAAKSNHAINRVLELQKGLGYLLFSNHYIELGLVLMAAIFVPEVRKALLAPALWLALYIVFFSAGAAWWPWYVPPMFVAGWFMTGIAMVGLATLAEEKISAAWLRGVLKTGVLAVLAISVFFSFDTLVARQSTSSAAYLERRNASQKIGNFISTEIPPQKTILVEPIGLIGWYAPLHRFLDYPGLSHPEMSSYLSKLKWKVPHRLTDFKTDSLILAHFRPDYAILWREELAQFQLNINFLTDYYPVASFAYFRADPRMDSVWIFKRVELLTR